MINSKLVSLLQHLDGPEQKELGKWIQFKAGGRDSFKLFNYLMTKLKKQKHEKLEKEKIYRALFRDSKYNDLKIRFMSFELLRLSEDYIVYKTNSQNNFQYQLSLLRFYQKRNLPKFFDQTFASIQKELSQQQLKDSDYFFVTLQADREYNKYLKSKQNRSIEPQIQKLSDDLDLFYLLNKIVISCEALNYKNIVKTDYNIRFVDDLLSQIKKEDFDRYPTLRLHYLALMTLREEDNEKHFHQLKRNILKYRKILSADDLRDLYTLARNYCIRKINLGNQEFSRELFDLYQRELELLRHSEVKELSPMIYKNITALAFKLEEYDWTFQFIQHHTQHLPAEHRDSYFNFNMARYYFIKKDFDKVIELLSHVEYNDFFIQLSAKALLLKTYFELEEFSVFDSLAHSFRSLLKNKRALGYHRSNYLNFIRYTEKLFSRKTLSKKESGKLKAEIQKTKEIFDREWMLEKLGEVR